MASINLSGVLRNPDTTLASGGEVRLIHRSNTGEVVAGFRETLNVNNDGTYDFNIQYGNVFIQTRDVGVNQWTDHGTLTINQDTSATTLPELLNAAVPPTDAQLLEFQILLSDAEAAADRAEAAGERSIKVYPTLADIQADSELESGKVVTNFQSKLDYYISETQEAGGVPVTGTTPQLYANPQQTTPGTGETNTASNIGVGEGPFAQKVASDLQFYSQVSQYGLESHLIDGTYYRGLNPFVADNIGAFVGDMTTTRSTKTTITNRSGVVEDVSENIPAYGIKGLSCFGAVTNEIIYSEDVFNPAGWSLNTNVIEGDSDQSSGVVLKKVVADSSNSSHSLRQTVAGITGSKAVCAKLRIKRTSEIPFIRVYLRSSDNNFRITQNINTSDGSHGLSQEIGGCTIDSVRSNINGDYIDISIVANMVDSSSVNHQLLVYLLDSDTSNTSFLGDSVSGVYIGAAQLSESDYHAKYVRTEEAAITTLAERHSINASGNSSKIFTIVLDCEIPNFGAEPRMTISSNWLKFFRKNSENKVRLLGDSAVDSYIDIDDRNHRYCIKSDGITSKIFLDGVEVGSSSAVTFTPQLSGEIDIGGESGTSRFLNSSVKIKKWLVGECLSDQQIADLGGPDNVIL